MSKYKVIALVGANGSGKDTIASIIKEILEANGSRVIIKPFADRVRDVCARLENTYQKDAYINQATKNAVIGDYGYTRRDLMLDVTDLGLKLSKTHWWDDWKLCVDSLREKILFNYVIVPDFRYKDSLKYIKDTNGILISVDNEEIEDKLSEYESMNLLELKELADYSLFYEFNGEDSLNNAKKMVEVILLENIIQKPPNPNSTTTDI